MSTVPNPAPPAGRSGAQIEDLRAEFPGWTIQAWRAARDGGRSGPLEIVAQSYGTLRAALDEVDRVDSRHAIVDLRDALRAHGLHAEVYGLTVHTQTRSGILRVVTARRGVYTWGSGVELGPIGDHEAAAARMLPGLGMQP